jgi:ABC-type transport system substrate-binding protein
MEVLLAMIAEGGIRFKLLLEDYATVYIAVYQYSKGLFDGASAMPGGVRADAGQMLQIFYHSNGSAGRIPPNANPAMDALIEKQLREPDREKRIAMTHEIQKTLAKGMDALPVGFQTRPYNLVWPWLQNRGTYRSWVSGGGAASTELFPYLWYDASKRPA